MAVPSHWVAVPLVLALQHKHDHEHDDHDDHEQAGDNLHLAGGGAVGPMGSGGTGVVAESASPPGETAATP